MLVLLCALFAALAGGEPSLAQEGGEPPHQAQTRETMYAIIGAFIVVWTIGGLLVNRSSFRAMRESKERLEHATHGGNVGIITYDVAKNEVYISPLGYHLLGHTAHAPIISNEEWLDWIHIADVELFQLNVFTAENASNTTPSTEIRIKTRDDSYKWFSFSFKAQIDEHNRPVRLSGAFLDIDERKKIELTTRELAFTDAVSGARNRNYLMTEGEKMLIAAQKNNLGVGLVIFDIDNFKALNMQKGTAGGDRLLREVAEKVKAVFSSDALFARLSADEFACMTPVAISHDINEHLNVAVNVLRDTMRAIDGVAYGASRITICSGTSIFPIDATDLPGLIENASISLLAAKAQGPDNFRIYDENVKARTRRENILRRDIHDMINNNQLKVFYQAKVDLATGRLAGAEALARWFHPDFGVVSPDYFIKLAEDMGAVKAIDHFMIELACLQNSIWQSLGLPPVRIAVNMSSEGFFDKDTAGYISGALRNADLDAQWLEIELTESMAMRDVQQAIDTMRSLDSLGVTVSLDDFGTGYSSLNHMKKLPIKMIKLDRSFILDIDSNPASRMIVNTMVQLSKNLNLSVTVEGVENTIQEELLKGIGCEYGQGYLYSKPLPAEEFENILRAGRPLGRI